MFVLSIFMGIDIARSRMSTSTKAATRIENALHKDDAAQNTYDPIGINYTIPNEQNTYDQPGYPKD